MPTVADYCVVNDDPFTLGVGAGQENDRDLQLSFDLFINTSIRSVLSYMVDPGPAGVTFDMVIMPGAIPVTGLITLPPQGGHARQEVLEKNVLLPGPSQKLRVLVTAGSATFSDIVIMHQNNT